eukprot:7232784-Prymnesium_polylepis.1
MGLHHEVPAPQPNSWACITKFGTSTKQTGLHHELAAQRTVNQAKHNISWRLTSPHRKVRTPESELCHR